MPITLSLTLQQQSVTFQYHVEYGSIIIWWLERPSHDPEAPDSTPIHVSCPRLLKVNQAFHPMGDQYIGAIILVPTLALTKVLTRTRCNLWLAWLLKTPFAGRRPS